MSLSWSKINSSLQHKLLLLTLLPLALTAAGFALMGVIGRVATLTDSST